MNVIFCASEAVPFIKTGGLADVCGSLPLALESCGINVTMFLPHYKVIDVKENKIKRFDKDTSIATVGRNIKVYFIESRKYFHRQGLYVSAKGDYKDNLKRFSFFCRAILERIKRYDLKADIIHCHDWQTALLPVYLKEFYSNDSHISKIKSLLTVHNLAFQGIFPNIEFKDLGLRESLFSDEYFEFYGKTNLLKAGIKYSHRVSTVSPQYAKEILTEQFGCGLQIDLKRLNSEIPGILNGVHYEIWDPAIDNFMKEKYTVKNWSKAKKSNKKNLQKELNLQIDEDLPMIGCVSRISHQKGFELIIESICSIMKSECQIVFQGLGEKRYCQELKKLAGRFKGRMSVVFEFSERLAHKIYGASDFFIMPSNFEPCGLSQLISLKYGTIPIVYKTGGLADTVEPFNSHTQNGTGFVFDQYTVDGFMGAVQKALETFKNKELFAVLVKSAMREKFTWESSARKYKELYRCLLLG